MSDPLARSRKRILAAGAAAALVSAVAAAPTFANIAPSTFDALNGDIATTGSGLTDWVDLTADTDDNLTSGQWTSKDDVPSGQNDDSFTQGTWENTEPPVPSTGSVPPNKSDLTRFYIGVEKAGDEDKPFLYLGWLRVLNPKGTTNMDFEFNQSETLSANGVTPVRSHGDVLVEYKLAKGGETPIIYVYKWNDGTGTEDANYPGCEGSTSYPCWSERRDVTAAGGAEGSVNAVTIDDPTTGDQFLPTGEADPYTFGEASLDLEATGLFTDGQCTTFGSAYLKSRSSDSFTAALKDFIAPKEINLSNCGQFTVVKQTENDAAGDFDFAVSPSAGSANADGSGGAVTGGTLADGESFTAYNVQPGAYDITETVTTGWKLDSVVCKEADGTTDNGSAITDGKTISVSADSNITCTFTNSKQRGSILVAKVVTATDVRIDGASFALDADGDTASTNDQTAIPAVEGETGLYCIDGLLFGDYTVVETAAPEGYADAVGTKTVSVGAASTCSGRDPSQPDATFENQKIPTIVTSAQTPVTVGETITDTATLGGGYNPTGSITFTAYSDDTCETEVFTDTVSVDSGNGDYVSGAYTTTAAGTIYWIASYSGDDSNTSASGECGDAGESSVVDKEKPTIVTSAQTPVTVGETITDTATLGGGYNPTGSITFTAYSDDTCETEVFTDTVSVDSGNGDYVSGAYTTTAAGTIYWIASYSGDDNNEPASGKCGDTGEASVVDKAQPTLSTAPVLLPNDSATLTGGFGTLAGTISFALYSDEACEGAVLYEENDVAVDGAGTYSTSNTDVFITADGTYSWEVTYSGDGNNEGAFSTCTDERYVIDVTPDPEVAPGLTVGP